MSITTQDFSLTPDDYLSEKDNLNSNASEFQCYVKCFSNQGAKTVSGYLGATSTGWATIVDKQHRWNLVKSKDDNTKFYLKNLVNPKKNYFLGSRDATKCAGLFYLKMNGDWLTYDVPTKKLINLTANRTFLGRHEEGSLYWITDAESRTSEYVRIDCEIIPV